MISYDFSALVLRTSVSNKTIKVGNLLELTLDVLLLTLLPEWFR